MTLAFISALVALCVSQIVLPKRWAFLPLMIAGMHLGNFEVLPQLTAARLILLIGLSRALFSGLLPKQWAKMDYWFAAFAAFALLSSLGHAANDWVPSPFRFRVGLVLNILGSYIYARSYLRDSDHFRRYLISLPFILTPLAIGMSAEQATRISPYYALGARSESVITRDDRARARGPFAHPILAGTLGATALPLTFILLRRKRKILGAIGCVSCLTIVLASASSGPLAAVASAITGILLWRWREKLWLLVTAMIAVAFAFTIYSGRGPWYLMAKIDLVGGSTGWHRAKLIDQAVRYIDEWWLWGTDYTRHWMPTGVSWSPNMVDITNYYLHLGVIGGLPLTVCLIAFLISAFRTIKTGMADLRRYGDHDEVVLWFTGVSLATHAISFISISYFDQMYIYFYALLGAIPNLVASSTSKQYFTISDHEISEKTDEYNR